MTPFSLPPYVAEILSGLQKAGHEAYLVGGCVRDTLLEIMPSDYDIATGARPEEIRRIFPRTILTGARFGTVTVLCGDRRAEVTTYRSESGYGDRRRPDHVEFEKDILKDLSRRDFTINAMAYSPGAGLLDPFDGRGDLKSRLIRAVGDPNIRFQEDALRMLRAYRFASRLGFALEGNTREAVFRNMPLAAGLSGERVKAELDRLLLSQRPSLIAGLMGAGLFDALKIPASGIAGSFPAEKLPPLPAVRWAAFLHFGKVEPGSLFKRLKFDNALKRSVSALLEELALPLPETDVQLKKRLFKLDPSDFELSLRIRFVFLNEETTAVSAALEKILLRKEPYRLGMLALNGGDLVKAGFNGSEVGNVLRGLLEYVIENPGANNRDTLLKICKK